MLKKTTNVILAGITSLIVFAGCGIAAEGEAPEKVAAIEGRPPVDAVVLFDGTDLDQWVSDDGQAPTWKVEKGEMVITEGNLITKEQFGDFQLHVEFMTPEPDLGKGQDKGNSGVYLQNLYEVQILESYSNETYYDGQCAAIYKQHAPLVNACRPPGYWQTYDIIFHAADLDENGNVVKKATITVLHNGVLVQDHVAADPTGSKSKAPVVERGPILLQDHHHPVHYRNIWIREL